jgi:hypothetical protein
VVDRLAGLDFQLAYEVITGGRLYRAHSAGGIPAQPGALSSLTSVNPVYTFRLRALGDAVLVQADDIAAHADRLGAGRVGAPVRAYAGGCGAAAGDDKRPLP